MGATLLAALGAGVAACTPGAASPAGSGPASPGMTAASPTVGAASGPGAAAGTGSGAGSVITTAAGPGSQGIMTGPGAYLLAPMPAGTVTVSRTGQGHLQAHIRLFGLTPGSSHAVAIDSLNGTGPTVIQFPVVTANATGQADTTLASAGRVAALPPASRLVIRLGSDGSTLAAEPIAESGVLRRHLGSTVSGFRAVTGNGAGAVTGQPRGRAALSYDAATQTLTVTVSASGLNPGPHAAHIHLGSCASQGPVRYMLPDFTADSQGDIDHQTRMVTGVAGVPGPGNWYLNLHMGGMNQILAGGTPTLSFRPLLCTNVTSVAETGATPMATATPAASGMPSGPAMPGLPISTPTPGLPISTPTPGLPASTPTMSPGATSTAVPASYPTHF
jgi:hypothetical protein